MKDGIDGQQALASNDGKSVLIGICSLHATRAMSVPFQISRKARNFRHDAREWRVIDFKNSHRLKDLTAIVPLLRLQGDPFLPHRPSKELSLLDNHQSSGSRNPPDRFADPAATIWCAQKGFSRACLFKKLTIMRVFSKSSDHSFVPSVADAGHPSSF
jgi:hypothetical protein